MKIGVQGDGRGRALTTTIVGLHCRLPRGRLDPIACRRAVGAGEPLHREVRQPSGCALPDQVFPLAV